MWWIIATSKTRKMIWFLKEKLSLLLMKFLMAVMPRLLLVEQGALENPTSFRSFSSIFFFYYHQFFIYLLTYESERCFLIFFKGTVDEPGLTVLAVDEMLRLAADNGKSIAVSFYEVDQDHHVKDLLDPNRQQVFVLKDAHGKTQLKGLSQV